MKSNQKPQKQRRFSHRMQKKLAFLFLIIVAVLVGLNIRISYISAKSGDQYTKQILSQQSYDSRTIAYKRGDILDRNNTVLATSEKVYNLIIDCKAINLKSDYIEPTVQALVSIMGVDETKLRATLTDETTKDSQYQILRTKVTIEEKQAFEAYKEIPEDSDLTSEAKQAKQSIKGVWFEDDYLRQYPQGSLASNLIGFSNANNDGTVGIEASYNDILNGINGREYGYLNEDLELQRTTIDPENGNTLVTTIDSYIQSVVEKYLDEFNEEYKDGPNQDTAGKGAKATAVIVADPDTGEILAMATSGSFDLNNPEEVLSDYTEEYLAALTTEEYSEILMKEWSNYCVSEAIEVGSTVKPMTIAAAIEAGIVSTDRTFICDGYEEIYDRTVYCSHKEGHGTLTLKQAIAQSCNDVLMQVAALMGVGEFCRYQNIFNFGRKTGIDLPNETFGILRLEEEMLPIDLAVNSFGQSFNISMMQEMAAFLSVINGGNYYQPHVVKQILDDNGNIVENIEPVLLKQTISTKTSALMREYMQETIEGQSGTGKSVAIKGYTIGGKTGTAETINKTEDKELDRDGENYLVSFIGFAPVNDPQVAIYVVVDRPNVEDQANSKYAQDIVRNILVEILPYMNIFPETTAVEETTEEETGELSEDGLGEVGAQNSSLPDPPTAVEDAEGAQ